MEATGDLMNRSEVFTPAQVKKIAEKSFDKPVVIVTQVEAEATEKGFEQEKNVEILRKNVRDFVLHFKKIYFGRDGSS
jgi:hypothetical protein